MAPVVTRLPSGIDCTGPVQSIPEGSRVTISEKKIILERMAKIAEMFSCRINKGGFLSVLNFVKRFFCHIILSTYF